MINADTARLISKISNDDIEWDGTPVGIMPVKVK